MQHTLAVKTIRKCEYFTYNTSTSYSLRPYFEFYVLGHVLIITVLFEYRIYIPINWATLQWS